MTQLSALVLKARHREIREGQETDASIRLHRAISWLARSEREVDDLDARFIFQWVALNAAYACEFGQQQGERERFHAFVAQLVRLDTSRTLHDALFRQFSGPIRTLVDNKFVFEPFWVARRTHDSTNRWEEGFSKGKKAALGAIAGGDTTKLLSIVFDRLYILRNQLVHGGATWNSQVNRDQLRDGTMVLGTVVPLVIQLMLEHAAEDFGEVLYPVI